MWWWIFLMVVCVVLVGAYKWAMSSPLKSVVSFISSVSTGFEPPTRNEMDKLTQGHILMDNVLVDLERQVNSITRAMTDTFTNQCNQQKSIHALKLKYNHIFEEIRELQEDYQMFLVSDTAKVDPDILSTTNESSPPPSFCDIYVERVGIQEPDKEEELMIQRVVETEAAAAITEQPILEIPAIIEQVTSETPSIIEQTISEIPFIIEQSTSEPPSITEEITSEPPSIIEQTISEPYSIIEQSTSEIISEEGELVLPDGIILTEEEEDKKTVTKTPELKKPKGKKNSNN